MRRPGILLLFAGLLAGLVAGLLGSRPAHAEPDPDAALATVRALEGELVETVDHVRARTVSVLSHSARAAPGGSLARPRPLKAVGTGVLVQHGGRPWVLTSLHVVDSPDSYEVITADGEAHPIYVRSRDASADLALLGFREAAPGLPGALLEDRPAAARPGAWVFATGNPFFLALDGAAAVSLGVVSGERPAAATRYIEGSILQHDAEINPGSSGGPLWSSRGRLLGVNGTIATRSRAQGAGPAYTGASFAVPVARAQSFLDRAFSSTPDAPSAIARAPAATPEPPPPVVRPVPYLGIRTRTQVGDGQRPSGALVTSVTSPSPVAPSRDTMGIRPGDVITRFQAPGHAWQIRSAQDVERAVSSLPPGALVSLRFVRGGRLHDWTGRLGERR